MRSATASCARTARSDLDASLLLLAPIGFLKPDDPRFRATVEAIERDLVVDGLVLRYDSSKAKDGLPPGEGAFLACSFWLADAYCCSGGARTPSGCSGAWSDFATMSAC